MEAEVGCPSYPESDREECTAVQHEMWKSIKEQF